MPEAAPQQHARRTCPNCGAELSGRYCAVCGQEDHPLSVPLHRLILDFLSDEFQFDARIWRTLHLLLFRPGRLTREYLSGKRQRFIPPVRLYLFVSIVFFLTVELLPSQVVRVQLPSYRLHPPAPRAATRTDKGLSTAAGSAPTAPSPAAATNIEGAVRSGLKQAMQGAAPVKATSVRGFEDWFITHSRAVKANPAQFRHRFVSNIPKVVFFLIPVFALLLKLLYLLRRRYYSEHLIFALHYHSVIFLNAFIMVLLSFGARSMPALPANVMRWGAGLLAIWTGLYIYPALRTTYADTWPRAIWRGSVLIFLYFFVAVVLGTVAAVAITFAMTGP